MNLLKLTSTTTVRRPEKRPLRYLEIDDVERIRSTLDLEPDPSTVLSSRAVTRIVRRRLPLVPDTSADSSNEEPPAQPTDLHANSRISSPTAGPSRLFTSASDSESNTDNVLDRLVGGEGVTEEEWSELTEVCGHCRFRYLARALRKHIPICCEKDESD